MAEKQVTTPSRDALRVTVPYGSTSTWPDGRRLEEVRPLTPSEWEAILEAEAPKHGWVKAPVCETCGGKPLAEGEYWEGSLPNGDEPDFDGPCPSCGGLGTKRMVAVDGEGFKLAMHSFSGGLWQFHAIDGPEDGEPTHVAFPMKAFDDSR